MPLSFLKHLKSVAVVVAVMAGTAALAYALWSKPLLDAEVALAAGNRDAALAAYARAEERFKRFPVAQRVLPRDYALSVSNQLALLYRSGNHDAVIAKAEEAPPRAAPRFWAGSALFALASAEAKSDVRVVLLSRAQAEFKQALEQSPDDWDTKYNYEVTGKLVEALRKKPVDEPDTLMQLVRPQQKQPKAVRKRG